MYVVITKIVNTKGVLCMSNNEMELLRMIREHDEPEKALIIAVGVITSFLRQHEPSEVPTVSYLLEHDGTGQEASSLPH